MQIFTLISRNLLVYKRLYWDIFLTCVKTVPVFCADTNYLIYSATDKNLNFLEKIGKIADSKLGDFDDLIYKCKKCSTIYHQVSQQYSINFEFTYFIIEEKKYGVEIGKVVTKPISLLLGLFGFDDNEIIKYSNDFQLVNDSLFFKYYTEK